LGDPLALLVPDRRLSPGAFFVWIALVHAALVALAVAILVERPYAGTAFLVLLWVWLALHANRRHDAGRSGKWLAVLVPVVAFAAILVALALVVVFGVRLPEQADALPDGDAPVIAWVRVAVVLVAGGSGVDLREGSAAGAAILAVAAAPFALTLVVTVLAGFAGRDPAENRWGKP